MMRASSTGFSFDENMKIQKFEQSGFIFEAESGFRLALDIGNKTSLGSLDGVPQPDAFLVSHIHGDHFHPANIEALAPATIYLNRECAESDQQKTHANVPGYTPFMEIIAAGNQLHIGPFNVTCFGVDHGPNITPIAENLGFLIEHDGKKIYFAGDMFYPPQGSVEDLEVSYALIPIGTFYTFGPEEAVAFARTFKKIEMLIPMHYNKTPETLDTFLEISKDRFSVKVMEPR